MKSRLNSNELIPLIEKDKAENEFQGIQIEDLEPKSPILNLSNVEFDNILKYLSNHELGIFSQTNKSLNTYINNLSSYKNLNLKKHISLFKTLDKSIQNKKIKSTIISGTFTGIAIESIYQLMLYLAGSDLTNPLAIFSSLSTSLSLAALAALLQYRLPDELAVDCNIRKRNKIRKALITNALFRQPAANENDYQEMQNTKEMLEALYELDNQHAALTK